MFPGPLLRRLRDLLTNGRRPQRCHHRAGRTARQAHPATPPRPHARARHPVATRACRRTWLRHPRAHGLPPLAAAARADVRRRPSLRPRHARVTHRRPPPPPPPPPPSAPPPPAPPRRLRLPPRRRLVAAPLSRLSPGRRTGRPAPR